MKLYLIIASTVNLVLFSTLTNADNSPDPNEILAWRGNGVVSQELFEARADKIPKNLRLNALRDSNRLKDLINNMLIEAQLAEDARQAGFDNEKIVINRMKLAQQAELANAWLEHYVDTNQEADLDQLAYEYYQLNKNSILTLPSINVSHLLVSTEERTDEEAKERAKFLYQEIEVNPALFDEMVLKYSDDKSVSSNKGKFTKIKKGNMVKPFEDAAFALQTSEISEPVKTKYGFHIIRLDAHVAPEQMPFDEVKAQLIDRERKKHEERIKNDYLSKLTSEDVNMTKESLEEMVRRQFGEDYVDPQVIKGDSE